MFGMLSVLAELSANCGPATTCAPTEAGQDNDTAQNQAH